jgi:hypothetical protein
LCGGRCEDLVWDHTGPLFLLSQRLVSKHFAENNLSDPPESVVSRLVVCYKLALHLDDTSVGLEHPRVTKKQLPEETLD